MRWRVDRKERIDALRVELVEMLLAMRLVRDELKALEKYAGWRRGEKATLTVERKRILARRNELDAAFDRRLTEGVRSADDALTLLKAAPGAVLSVWLKNFVLPAVNGSSPACRGPNGELLRLKGSEVREFCKSSSTLWN